MTFIFNKSRWGFIIRTKYTIESSEGYIKEKETKQVGGWYINVRCQVLTRFWFGLKVPPNQREHDIVFYNISTCKSVIEIIL